MATASVHDMIIKIETTFPSIRGVRDGEEWGAPPQSIHLGNVAEGGEIDGLPAADIYASDWDPKGIHYQLGIHVKLEALLNKHGWHTEWYDGGTVLAFCW